MSNETELLKRTWEDYQQKHPGVRIKDAADGLGVSELALLMLKCGEQVTRLEFPLEAFLNELESLGKVMSLTRNNAAVHEKIGYFRKIEIHQKHQMGLVLDDQIDLRLMLAHWHHALAEIKETDRGPLRSFQFFDKDGTAVHKVYVKEPAGEAAYYKIVEKYRSENQSVTQQISPQKEASKELPDEKINLDAFLGEWRTLKDTHDFFTLLRKYKISRTQALRLGEKEFTTPVPTSALRRTFEGAVDQSMEIMVFVGNRGTLQIHTGPINRLKASGNWFNVLDPTFSLHLREDLIDKTWVVRKPTADGIVTSLELFDASGWPIARLFGKRKPGQQEMPEWREMMGRLPAIS